jgi:hypothetical protein
MGSSGMRRGCHLAGRFLLGRPARTPAHPPPNGFRAALPPAAPGKCAALYRDQRGAVSLTATASNDGMSETQTTIR